MGGRQIETLSKHQMPLGRNCCLCELPHLKSCKVPRAKEVFMKPIHVLCHLCTKDTVISLNYGKKEDIFSNCWLLGPLKESMFLWVQQILFVVSEIPANISIIYTLRTATAGKVYLCCLFQGRILLPIQNE